MLIEYILVAYILSFLLFTAFLTIRVKRRTGIFPIIKNTSSTHGFVDRIVSLTYILMILNTIVFVSGRNVSALFELIDGFHHYWVQIVGLIIIGISFLLMFFAQFQMQDSWRIGIDKESDVNLVQSGLFKYLRHPIYLFALFIGVGMVCVIPSLASIFLLVLLYIILSIQSRLEEEFMLTKFEYQYEVFIKSRRRFF